MKTGRRRKKEEKRPEEEPISFSPPSTPSPSPAPSSRSASRPSSQRPSFPIPIPLLLMAAVLALLVICFCVGQTFLGPRAKPTSYVPATARGSWTAQVQLLMPQVMTSEGWRSDCEADADCTVLPGTCRLKQREDRYTEQIVDEYDDYAYNIYYEETGRLLYESADGDFVNTQLNPGEEWVDGDRYYSSEEWLDPESCQYTQYAIWITDPEDSSSEIEVLLSECEVWDHITVKERIYAEEEYCQVETVDTLAVQDTFTQEGDGAYVEWPDVLAPEDGRLQQEFEGVVVFSADRAERTVRTDDPDEYYHYMTTPHYLGIDENGKVVSLTDRAP